MYLSTLPKSGYPVGNVQTSQRGGFLRYVIANMGDGYGAMFRLLVKIVSISSKSMSLMIKVY